MFVLTNHVFSVTEYDLKNGKMPCQQEYWIKNMAVKIPIYIYKPQQMKTVHEKFSLAKSFFDITVLPKNEFAINCSC